MSEERKLTENELKKEFLNSYLLDKRVVKRLEEQLAELRLNKISPSCMIGDGMPHGTDLKDLSDYVVLVDELEREIWAEKYKQIKSYQIVRSAIEKMKNDREKDILTYRYIRGWWWGKIATEMGYSLRNIHYLHSAALDHLKIA